MIKSKAQAWLQIWFGEVFSKETTPGAVWAPGEHWGCLTADAVLCTQLSFHSHEMYCIKIYSITFIKLRNKLEASCLHLHNGRLCSRWGMGTVGRQEPASLGDEYPPEHSPSGLWMENNHNFHGLAGDSRVSGRGQWANSWTPAGWDNLICSAASSGAGSYSQTNLWRTSGKA